MSHCANFYTTKHEPCPNKAIYRQNEYVELCASCWNNITDTMFKKWHEWFKSDQSQQEPPIWVYNSDRII